MITFHRVFVLSYIFGFIGPSLTAMIQQPLPPEPAVAPLSSQYTLSQTSYVLGTTEPVDTFDFNVGDDTGIEYKVQVFLDGELVCEELLQPETLAVTPETRFFTNSSYDLETGGLVPENYVPTNPFCFVPWSAGGANVMMVGMGCTEEHPSPWTADDTVTVSGAAVTISKLFCPPKPSTYSGLLLWDTDQFPEGCRITFNVVNTMTREATFGVVNMLTSTLNYFVIDNQLVPFVDVPLTVLDARGGGSEDFQIAGPTISLPPGGTDSLAFTDSPSATLGRGCWTRTDGTNGTYTLIGYRLEFRTFVMQDWDEAFGVQTPIRGELVVDWAIQAQANRVNNRWAVDNAQSQLLQPPIQVPQPSNFTPTYTGFIQSKSFDTATYDDDTGCYNFH